MTCKHCHLRIHRCPAAIFRRHLSAAPCSGWLHDGGGHLDVHLAEPEARTS